MKFIYCADNIKSKFYCLTTFSKERSMKYIGLLFLLVIMMISSLVYGQPISKEPPRSPSGFPIQNVPNKISYQGLLTTSSGVPAANGTYTLIFDLYNDSLTGVSFWNETHAAVVVHNGTFNVLLGASTPFPTWIFSYSLYLQVTAQSGPGISSPVTFTPRTPLASVPYSLALRLPFSAGVDLPSNALEIDNVNSGASVAGYNYSADSTSRTITGYSQTGTGVYGE